MGREEGAGSMVTRGVAWLVLGCVQVGVVRWVWPGGCGLVGVAWWAWLGAQSLALQPPCRESEQLLLCICESDL